eukprot:TRINITY_DN13193_c0_g1_i1.p2 TRINITY_DN13193_c0_g1~~TRINITY_DN13193_c0_g1_i1.p2  ORF type:complete len:327 (+),score=79.92 TRINITY_DN13193_c0_g1_i1:1635-2615(+)
MDKARVVMWKEFGVVNSFTWETSQFAYTHKDEIVQFTDRDHDKMAIGFMETLYQHSKLSAQIEEELHANTSSGLIKKEPKSKDISKVKIQLNIPLLQSSASAEGNNSLDDEFLQPTSFDNKESEGSAEMLLNLPWKHYFSQQELDDLFNEINSLLELDVSAEEIDARSKYEDEKKCLVKYDRDTKSPIISKDLTRIGFLRRSHDVSNVRSIKVISKKLPEKLKAQILKLSVPVHIQGAAQKLPTFTNERLREVARPVQPLFKRRQIISGLKGEAEGWGIQRDVSVKRYRPSTSSFKSGQKKCSSFVHNPFTNSMIREHITVMNDYN